MAKLKIEFENGEIKRTLTFRDKDFVLTMGEWDNGVRRIKEKCFYDQVKKAFTDDEDELEFMESDFDVLEYGEEDEIEDALEVLNNNE